MRSRPIHFALLSLSLVGCGAGPAVLGSDDLPVRRVVLYRNGVAYFERSGQFEGNELEFGVRQSEVGDFLSSLTAIERGEGGVRSVSFEVPEPEVPATPPAPPPPQPGPYGYPSPPPPPPAAEPAPDADPRVDVRLRLSGDDDHDVTVAYVVGAPIWRPTYRIVTAERGQALLQAWAVVQNTSGEDWRDVTLSLTTGAPIAFQSDLGTPVTPPRPHVTDTGEVVMAVPQSEVALAQGEATPPSDPATTQAGFDDGNSVAAGDVAGSSPARGRSSRPAVTAPRPAPAPGGFGGGRPRVEEQEILNAQRLQQSVSVMAATAVLGAGVTRYDISERVTVPDGGSTMVAILSRLVPGEEAHLFAPDPGVPLSRSHPFRVVKIANRTGAMLERGPVSVIGGGSFLGQGVLEPLPRDATTFVPFAVDRSVAVEANVETGEAEGRLVRISHGMVTVERFTERTTVYQVRNGGAAAVKVYVRHTRMPGATILRPPAGTEQTETSALAPIRTAARGEQELRLVERTPVQRTVEFISDVAADAVALYLSGPAVDAAAGPALRRALELRTQLVTAQRAVATASEQRHELSRNAEETRQNLEAIRALASAADLRQRLVTRLSDLDQRIAALTRTIVDNQTTSSELQVRLADALQDVTLDTSPRAPSTPPTPR